MSVGPGEEWGSETTDPPEVEVSGTDADLATAVSGAPVGVRVRFHPDATSDLARALGLVGRAPGPVARLVPMDTLALAGERGVAVNAVILGVAPDRLAPWHRRIVFDVAVDGGAAVTVAATGVAVFVGQYLRGCDVSPRGHPGDGVCEVHIYGLPPGQRRAMRARLRSGTHLPHPAITTRRARTVAIRCSRHVPMEVDGRPAGRGTSLDVAVVPARYSLLL